MRIFCRPGIDKILICEPTYGMYKVSAQTNDVKVENIDLNFNDFSLNVDAIIEKISSDNCIKIIYLTSPGNPTGKLLPASSIYKLLDLKWPGIIVVDEAYIDFSPPKSSFARTVLDYENLVVLQTLSKSFGLAGIRFGMAFAHKSVAYVANCLKAPYNISTLTATVARKALLPSSIAGMKHKISKIIKQREFLIHEFAQIKGLGPLRGGIDANFLLIPIMNKDNKPDSLLAFKVYDILARRSGVVIRYRGKDRGCEGCVRITVGLPEENQVLVENLKSILKTYQEDPVKFMANK